MRGNQRQRKYIDREDREIRFDTDMDRGVKELRGAQIWIEEIKI